MSLLRKTFAIAAASAALGVAALAASPANAQGWNDDGYGPGSRGGYMSAYGAGPNGPYGPDGYGAPGYGYGVDAGEEDIAICPPGYHLGRQPGLCWPNRG